MLSSIVWPFASVCQDIPDVDRKIAEACLQESGQRSHAFKQKILAAEKREVALSMKGKKNKKEEEADPTEDATPAASTKKTKKQRQSPARRKPQQNQRPRVRQSRAPSTCNGR